MLESQNFSVYAGNTFDVYIDIDPDDAITLIGAIIHWRVYPQSLGRPLRDAGPVLDKHNDVGGTLIVDDPDTQKLLIPLDPADTRDMLRNYYHECIVDDETRGTITVAHGIMTVLESMNPEEETT